MQSHTRLSLDAKKRNYKTNSHEVFEWRLLDNNGTSIFLRRASLAGIYIRRINRGRWGVDPLAKASADREGLELVWTSPIYGT
jgi:hypothetical protein